MRRICFTLQVKPERMTEYRRRHAQVWPDLTMRVLAEVFNVDDQLRDK